MVFKTTFNNISAISWQSVLLVEETEVPGENRRPCDETFQVYMIDILCVCIYENIKTHKILSDCCLTPVEQFFSCIMVRTSYISMRWWCLLCTRPTGLVGLLIVLAHWNPGLGCIFKRFFFLLEAFWLDVTTSKDECMWTRLTSVVFTRKRPFMEEYWMPLTRKKIV
jgi:hypothetical protein